MDNKTDSRSIIYMLISALSFSIMALFVRQYPESQIPLMYKIVFRNIIILLVILISIPKNLHNLVGPKGSRKWLLFRGLAGTIGMLFYFYSISQLDLADSSMLNKISPVFVTFIALFLLHERPSPLLWIALVTALSGAFLVIRPGFNADILPALSGLLGAIFAAAAYTSIRKITSLGLGVNKLTVILYFSLFSLLSGLPFALATPIHFTPEILLNLVLIGVFAMGGQWFLTLAYAKGSASKISIINYSSIVFSMLLGLFFLNQRPDIYSISGAVLIIASAFISRKATVK